MTPSFTTDVVIVGGGPVGLSLALLLARRGVRSAVIEKKPEPDPHSRAVLLFPRTIEVLNEIGVLDAFKLEGQINRHVRLRRADNRQTLLDFDFNRFDDVTECNFAIAIPQDRTDRILLRAATASEHISLYQGCEFTEFTDDGSDGHISIQIRDATGRVSQLRGRYLVGADGAHSSVRQQLGWDLDGKTYATKAFLADVEIREESDTNDGLLMAAEGSSFVVSVRYAPKIWRIIEQDIPPHISPEREALHARELATRLFGPNGWRHTLWTSAYKKHERCANAFRQNRVLLVGDAAHLNSPAGGQGLNTGMRDAHNLAWKLDAIMNGNGDPEILLSSYDIEQRSSFAKDVAPLTDSVERIQAAPAWMRRIAFSNLWLGRSIGVDTGLTRRLSMLFIRYGPSPILDEGGSNVGRRMPNVDLAEGRLYDQIGRWGLLLARDGDETAGDYAQAVSVGNALDIPVMRLPRALDEQGFGKIGIVYVRPDHVVGHSCMIGAPFTVDDVSKAMGLRSDTHSLV